MNFVQRHRGPDDEGYFYDDELGVSLGMRRLSIVDVAGGHQPMRDSSGRFVIVFNGEIFNAPALRQELVRDGFRFNTDHSDTEVVLNLYARDGERCVDRLNGMFAFAIYDTAQGHFFLARDPAGIKPLFYMQRGTMFAFASELKSLMTLSVSSREIDRQSLSHYLSLQYIPGECTIYAAVKKISGGHCLSFDIGRNEMKVTRYWQPQLSAQGSGSCSYRDTVASLREQLERAAAAWTMSDVGFGCSLSGGIDSAAIVGLVASRVGRVKTWTLGFGALASENSQEDERGLAKLVASKWDTDHHEIVIEASSLLDDLGAMVRQLDEPYGGGLPSWYVYREMANDVKVAITGSGGDELFGNYGKWRAYRHMTVPWAARVVRSARRHGLGELQGHPHGALYPVFFGELEKKRLLRDPLASEQSTPALLEARWLASAMIDPRQAIAYVDFCTQLPEEFLMMTDRFSMYWSVEARTPFLDRCLVDFVLALPADIRSNRKILKKVLIDSVRDLLPPQIVTSRKRGFVMPIASWLRKELLPMVRLYFDPLYLRRQAIFNDDLYDQVVRPHVEERADLSSRIWTILMFQLWWQENIGERG